MSLARPIGLPKDREEKPIIRFWQTAKRAAPRTIEWGRGQVKKKVKAVGAERGGEFVLQYFVRNRHFLMISTGQQLRAAVTCHGRQNIRNHSRRGVGTRRAKLTLVNSTMSAAAASRRQEVGAGLPAARKSSWSRRTPGRFCGTTQE
jgi:hypothetical protein